MRRNMSIKSLQGRRQTGRQTDGRTDRSMMPVADHIEASAAFDKFNPLDGSENVFANQRAVKYNTNNCCYCCCCCCCCCCCYSCAPFV